MKKVLTLLVVMLSSPVYGDELRLFFPEDETISSTDVEKERIVTEIELDEWILTVEEDEASPSTVKP